ncbi:fructosamine kinase family protein [Acidomonas methanolica]|uniref:Fructosamine-3-kinase n=1 Tax=Acidomonas methanolica NBRC 104435 TaxID=1231351 RepID=A0A023D7B9_ACIMT|nr:fructosamine kinase family protein [Acidomonas methanolica]TCS27347.1 fructosamine-3-kinase [Acidomonas methanolica]GAJ29999.1 fructosamine-3-kinase [Acidomonas methanolica NBRC 104435]GBQ49021.1 fructosamine-3-kinase [Acidomonas methanolica]GEK99627.1 aminoglycoside phosphotransferase [Acidomonas methanolica NBRC 104435]
MTPRDAAALLRATITAATPLGGGDLSEVMAITFQRSGEPPREAVVKTGPFPPREARMLDRLRAAGAPAPPVLAVDDALLVMERLPANGSLSRAWASLGHILRALHAAPVPETLYGWDEEYAFGTLAIANARGADWAEFWRDRRILCHAPFLPTDLARRLDRLAATLPARLPAAPRPSLLHGDLWSGNVLVAQERISGLIDPACCIGHHEADFAILTLFSRPPPAFWTAYGPLEPGWRERVALYRLWPALVHLRLFGASYRPLVEDCLENLI